MKKKLIALAMLLSVCCFTQAHEFWLQSDKYLYAVGESIAISFKVGENFMGEPWTLKTHRLQRMELHRAQAVTDLRKNITEGEKDNLRVAASQEGTHLFVMESNQAFIALDGEKFNAYLREDGLDEVYDQRERTNTLTDSAKELYSRHTKLLVQAGNKADDTYRKEVGLPVEIIPQKNPYVLKVGDVVNFKILFQGKPMFGAKVKVWNRHNNRTTIQNIYAQQDGMIEARISNPGSWMVSVVKMVPSKDPKANWQSYWGSLVFGIK